MIKVYIIKRQIVKNEWKKIAPKQARYLRKKVKNKVRDLMNFKSEQYQYIIRDENLNKKFRCLNIESLNFLNEINTDHILTKYEVDLLKDVFRFLKLRT